MRWDPDSSPWQPYPVEQVATALGGAPGWWLSGGLALDEHLGRTIRLHGDTDVTVARRHWPAVAAALRERLEVWIARDGHLHDTATHPVDGTVDNLWAREPGGPWRLQLNLEPVDADTWTYRRDPRVTRPLADGERAWLAGAVRLAHPSSPWRNGSAVRRSRHAP